MSKGISLPVVQSGLETSIQQGVKSVGTIKIPATIDPSAFKNLAQPLGRVSGLATEFEKSIAASNARVLAFGASVGIINGVQNAFADLVRTGIEVQKTLADIAAISGKGGKELEKFGDQLFNVGKLTGQSFKTAAQAALEFSRQGLNTEETLKRTTDALTLTRFTSLSAAEAVDVLTAAANSFSESGITTAQIINKLVAVDTKFAVSAEDLANGLARAGSIAQEVGVNFDELNAAITVAQEKTARGGAVIGNALKTIFTRIRSDETVNALQEIGVYSKDLEGNLKPATQILSELSLKLKDLGGQKKIEILEAVASKYNINILSALLGDLNDANSKFGQVVQISSQASNEAYARQIELNKTLAAQINEVTVSVGQLLTKLAEIGVTENLSSLLKFVNGLLDGFNNLLDSEGIGGNIAKGLISGISDVFFKIGLPIIGAIFIKLSRDVAKFALDSLQTILGINQQVRERQALEQAVVNTLIRDEQVMASILSLSGNRAKQEEYLLGIYNRQLAAMQQLQNIASSVTPALMQAGFSATTGQIRKRSAGGYLPGQEASDVRRGVGGASPSSKVVSIPNFAFGGGKRGTMIANTSEYIVPNFANGGSAIFNQDMARAYGLPAGARKISASGGYIPNFAETINADEKYVALVGQKLESGKSLISQEARYAIRGEGKNFSISKNKNPNADKILFNVFGVPAQSATGSTLEETKAALEDVGKNLAVKTATAITGGVMPKPEQLAKTRAKFNPGSLSSFAGSIFEASVGALLGDKSFEDVSSQAITSAFDFDLSKDSAIRTAFGIKNQNSKYLEVKGSYKESLMDSVAKKIYQVAKFNREAISTGKIKLQSPTVGERGKNARAFTDKSGTIWLEKANNQFEAASQDVNLDRYDTKAKKPANPSSAIWGGRDGFVPNFAASPLGDAISREIGAGVLPSQVRVTQDGRLRSAQNPGGLAVINTRDEPNGRIPNFNASGWTSASQPGAQGINPSNNTRATIGTDAALGKFLALQAAIVGVTGAVGSFADESSTTKDTIEALGGITSTVVTGMSLFAAGLGPFAIGVGVAAAAITTLGPIFYKFIKSFESESDKAIESLAKLQQQAEKTGKTLTPEEILGALQKKGEEAKQKKETLNIKDLIQAQYKNVSFNDEQLRSITSILQTTGGIQRNASTGEVTGIKEGALASILSGPNMFRFRGGSTGASVGAGAGYTSGSSSMEISNEALDRQIGKRAKAQIEEDRRTFKEKAPLTEEQARIAQEENRLITIRQSILNKMFETELGINKTYNDALLLADKRLAAIEREKGLLTEEQAIRKRNEQERAKAEAEFQKSRSTAVLQLQKGLGAGTKDTVFGEKSQDFFKALDPKILETLADNFYNINQESGGFASAWSQLVEIAQKNGIKIAGSFNSLNKGTQETVLSLLRTASEANQTAQATKEAKNAQINFTESVQLSNTELQNLQRTYSDNLYALAVLNNQLEDGGVVQDKINIATQKLENSLIEQQVQNKIEIQLAKRKFSIDLQAAEEARDHARSMRVLVDINKRAKIDAVNLQKESENRIDQLQKEAINSALKLKLDLDVLDAETLLLQSYNKAYSDSLKLRDIDAKTENTRAKLIKSEQEKDAELQVQINTLSQNIDAEKADVKRKTELLKVRNAMLGPEQRAAMLLEELNYTTEQLIETRAKAIASFDPSVMEASIGNERINLNTRQLSDIERTIAQGSALTRERVTSNMELQAKAAIFAQKTVGRGGEISAAESADILSGRSFSMTENFKLANASLMDETKTFNQIVGIETPKLFANGMADAMQAALNQADNLGEALSGIAQNFLKTLQSAFLQSASNQIVSSLLPSPIKLASGGLVTGGNGYKDDVPALLTSGEFVMRKSAVQKYGIENLSKMNAGGIFLPGVRGGGNITGYDQLRAFANQTTTSGATDILRGSGSSAFVNLEDQSARLSRFGLLNEDTINQEIRSAQEQGLNIIAEREAYRTQQRKAFQQQLMQTIASAALNYGVGKVLGPKPSTAQIPNIADQDAIQAMIDKGAGSMSEISDKLSSGITPKIPNINSINLKEGNVAIGNPIGLKNNLLLNTLTKTPKVNYAFNPASFKFGGKAYGGLIRRYAMGGPTDNIPALLMDGEYIINRQATSKYGKRFLDSMNKGMASRFADGGEVGSVSENTSTDNGAKMMGDVNISINVTGQGTQTEAQGNTNQGGIDYKKMSERIKAVVLETINEEKRLGGALRSR